MNNQDVETFVEIIESARRNASFPYADKHAIAAANLALDDVTRQLMRRKKLNDGACPECGSDNVEGKSVDTGGNSAAQAMYCIDCPATWVNGYTLTSQEVL